VNLNLNSGEYRTYRGKLIEENLEANGPSNYFKELYQAQDAKVKVTVPHF
jgi:hypothetical protein